MKGLPGAGAGLVRLPKSLLGGGPDAISPTAHYTGHVWSRNGLSHPALATTEGRVLFSALEPVMRASRSLGGPSLEAYLLARHRAIDGRLEEAITAGAISQVVEIAAGMSPRGWRFSRRFGPELTYIEADLPAMAARKRRALERIGSLGPHHQVRELDALRDTGPLSLPALSAELDPARGLVIITEGLLGYVAPQPMRALWQRLASTLHGFRAGRYLSDLHLGDVQTPEVRAFRVLLAGFVRGGVYLHFASAAQAVEQLRAAGFDAASVLPAGHLARDGGEAGASNGAARGKGGSMAHILEASTE